MDNRSLPLAILRLPRETEYGLHFYRNQKIARYEAGAFPTANIVDHSGRVAKKHRKVDARPASDISGKLCGARAWIITGWGGTAISA